MKKTKKKLLTQGLVYLDVTLFIVTNFLFVKVSHDSSPVQLGVYITRMEGSNP